MSQVTRLLLELASPLLCRVGVHRLYDAEADVPRRTVTDGWWVPLHGQGRPVRRCYFCGKEWPR